MTELDPGHRYYLQTLDGVNEESILQFVKREGPGYPGNVGHCSGTNLQEIFRASIARLQYLQRQEECSENFRIISRLRSCLLDLETRAARRHGRQLNVQQVDIESLPTCAKCGHIGCTGQCHV